MGASPSTAAFTSGQCPSSLGDVMVPSWLLLCLLSHGSSSREQGQAEASLSAVPLAACTAVGEGHPLRPGGGGGLPGFCLLCVFSGLVQGLDVGHLLWCCSPSSGVLLTLCHLHPLPKGSLIFGCNLGCVCSLDSITYFQYFLCFKTAYTTSLFFMLSSF